MHTPIHNYMSRIEGCDLTIGTWEQYAQDIFLEDSVVPGVQRTVSEQDQGTTGTRTQIEMAESKGQRLMRSFSCSVYGRQCDGVAQLVERKIRIQRSRVRIPSGAQEQFVRVFPSQKLLC